MPIKPARTITIHPAALAVIKQYTQLNICGAPITAPYYMNPHGRKGRRRVRVGKGTPEALQRETVRLARKYKFDLSTASAEQIRQFMIDHGLGIDCSGFVAWVLHTLVQQQTRRSLWRSIRYQGHPLRAFLVRRIRPVEHVSARLLTDELNATTVHSLYAIQPGDIIRCLNGRHILLITEVGYDAHDTPVYLTYVHSTEYNGVKYGIRQGQIHIHHPDKHIIDQEWIDEENGVNWTVKAARDFPDDTRVVRLQVLAAEIKTRP